MIAHIDDYSTMQSFPKWLAEALERTPMWPETYTRVINAPSIFMSWKRVAQELCLHMADAAQQPESDRDATAAILIWDSFTKVPARPVYFVRSEFASAMCETSREAIAIADLPLPYPAGILVLERGDYLKSSTIGALRWCVWAVRHSTILMFFQFDKAAMMLSQKDSIEPDRLRVTEDISIEPQEVDVLKRAGRLVINTFLVQSIRPTLIRTGKRTAITPRGLETWEANIIGGDFKIRYEPRAGEPTGITRRAHWVSGHLRNQACGPQHKERKMIWIEPYMTGLAPEDAKEKENG